MFELLKLLGSEYALTIKEGWKPNNYEIRVSDRKDHHVIRYISLTEVETVCLDLILSVVQQCIEEIKNIEKLEKEINHEQINND
jgi:hypothetical protein